MIPLSPLLNYFFTTQHVKYASKGSHKRQRAGVEKEKKCPWANLYIFSMRWAREKKKRKASSTQQPQSAGTIALETTQGHFVLLCQLSHSIQRDEGRKKLCSRAPARWTRLWYAPRDSLVTSEDDFNVWLWVFFRNTTKPWSQMKTRIDEHRWLNTSSSLPRLQYC